MKKLLVLLLIIGMASAANAAIMISVDGDTSQEEIDLPVGETVTIGVYVTDTANYIAYLTFVYVSEGGFELSNPRFSCPSPIDPPYPPIPPPIDDMIVFELILPPEPGQDPCPPGNWFEVDLTCMSAYVDVFVELWDDAHGYVTPVDTLTIHQVPEPMTLALLGFGGLLVLGRRRK